MDLELYDPEFTYHEPATSFDNLDTDALTELKEQYDNALSAGNKLYTVLTAAGYKDGSFITGLFDTEAEQQEFTDTATALGLKCAAITVEHGDTVVSQLFMTQDAEYDEDAFRDLVSATTDAPFVSYDEREMGQFLGYADADIDAYLRSTGTEDDGHEPATVRSLAELPPEYREELEVDNSELARLDVLVPEGVRNTIDGYREAIETAQTRDRALQGIRDVYGVDFTSLPDTSD